jgi:hypothetical protein
MGAVDGGPLATGLATGVVRGPNEELFLATVFLTRQSTS